MERAGDFETTTANHMCTTLNDTENIELASGESFYTTADGWWEKILCHFTCQLTNLTNIRSSCFLLNKTFRTSHSH